MVDEKKRLVVTFKRSYDIMKKALQHLFILLLSLPALAQQNAEDALAMQYYQNGEFDKAYNLYERLFKRNPASYYDQYLNSLIKLKKLNEAEKLAKSMMKSFPENYSYKIDFGKILQEQGQQEKAVDWYNSLIKDLPKNELLIRDLSINFYRADAYDYSVKTLVTGRKILNDEAAFAYDLLTLYRYQKNKQMLVYEYLNLLGFADAPEQVLNQAKNNFLNVFENPEDYESLRNSLIRKIQKTPQNIYYSDLLSWVYLQQEEYDLALKQTIALDKRLKEEGDRVYDLSLVLVSNKAYSAAIEGFEYLISRGSNNQYYIPSKIQMLNVKSQQLTSKKLSSTELSGLEKEYNEMLQEFGKNRNTIFAMRQLANLKAYHLNKPKEAVTLLEEALRFPAIPASVTAQTKLELADVYILSNEPWEATLVYSQIEKDYANEPAAQEAKFRNARLSYFQGDFAWAKAQLDVLKSSTSQLIANDALNLGLLIQENTANAADTNALVKYSKADLLIFSNQPDKALLVLDSINSLYPNNSLADDILMAKYRIFLKQDNLQQAVKQLQLIVDNYSFDVWGDDALFILGDLFESKLNDPEKAKTYFQRIITDFPGSLHVTEARKRFRNLRGDNIG